MSDDKNIRQFPIPTTSSSAGTAEIIKNLTTLPTSSPSGELLDIVSPSPSTELPETEDQSQIISSPALKQDAK